MKVYVVTEDNGYRSTVVGVYKDRVSATEKKMERFADRDIYEFEVED